MKPKNGCKEYHLLFLTHIFSRSQISEPGCTKWTQSIRRNENQSLPNQNIPFPLKNPGNFISE